MRNDYKNLLECRYLTTVEVSELFLRHKISSANLISDWSMPSMVALIKISWRNPNLTGLVLSALEDVPFASYLLKLLALVDTKKISRKLSLEDLSYIINVVNKTSQSQFLSNDEILDLPPTMAHLLMKLKKVQLEYDLAAYGREVMESSEIRLCNSMDADSHLRSLSMMLACYDVGNDRQAFFYAEQTIQKLYEELSYFELIEICRTLLPKLEARAAGDAAHLNRSLSGIIMIYATTLFSIGEYAEAFKAYDSLTTSDNPTVRNEAIRKTIRCLERQGGSKTQAAISKGELYLAEYEGDTLGKAKLLRTLGWSYHSFGHAEQALKHSLEAMALLTGLARDKNKGRFRRQDAEIRYNMARVNNTIGSAYEVLADYGKSAAAHKACLNVMKGMSRKWHSASLLNLSIVLRKQGNYRKAIMHAEKARNMKQAMCDYDDLPPVLYNLSFAYLRAFFALKQKRPGSRKPDDYLRKTISHTKEAISLRMKQGSEKRVIALHCIGVLAQLLLAEEGGYDFLLFFRDGENLDGIAFETDKQQLLNKTLSVLSHFDAAIEAGGENSEQELPEVTTIVGYMRRSDALGDA